MYNQIQVRQDSMPKIQCLNMINQILLKICITDILSCKKVDLNIIKIFTTYFFDNNTAFVEFSNLIEML